MKMIKYLSAAACMAAFSLTACEDYLDVAPENTETANGFYATATQAEQGLNGIYHYLLPSAHHIFFLSECRSDENYAEGDTERDFNQIAWFVKEITTLGELNGAWVDYYGAINHINEFLSKSEGITGWANEKVKKQFIGEAHFLRAFAYFELVRYFGNIPVYTDYLLPESPDVKQSKPEVAYELIVSDLKIAEEYLNNAPTDVLGKAAVAGKPTQIAAKAMLGRVYMTMAGFPLKQADKKQLAMGKFKEVLDYAGVSANGGAPAKYWAADAKAWQSMFLEENDNKYWIWEIQYANNKNTSIGTTTGNTAVFEMSPYPYNTDLYPGRIFGNQIYVAADILNEYGHPKDENGKWVSSYGTDKGNKDKRADWTVCYLSGNDLINSNTKAGYSGDPFYTKFLQTTPKRKAYGLSALSMSSSNYYYDANNFPIIRIEDVMLSYCELAGYSEYTLGMLNAIRSRQTEPVTAAEAAADWDNIVKRERRLEFTCEGIRWHDMVRREEINDYKTMLQTYYTTKFAADAVKNIDPKYYIYPIPYNQMTVKDGLYEQNEAYK